MHTSLFLDKDGKYCIQAISGTILYYSEIDPRIKPALDSIASETLAPTKDTNQKDAMLMYYLNAHQNGVLRYHASNMILICELESTYLVLPKSHSCAF